MTYLERFKQMGVRILGAAFAAAVAVLPAHSQTDRVVLREDFEIFRSTRTLRTVWPGGPALLETNAPGGGRCVSHDGKGMNRRGGFFVFPDLTHNIVLEADFYDFGTNTDQNVTVSLNGEDTHENVAFGLKGPSCYVARAGGLSSRTNWIPFKRGQLPMAGWHRFKGVVTTTNFIATVDYGRDGKVDRTLVIPFNKPPPTFMQLRFGGYSGKPASGGFALIDNIKLTMASVEAVAAVAKVQPGTNRQKAAEADIGTPGKPETNEVASSARIAAQTNTNVLLQLADVKTNIATDAAKAADSNTTLSGPVYSPRPGIESDAARGRVPNVTVSIAIWSLGAALTVIIALLGVLILMVRRNTAQNPRALLAESSHAGVNGSEALVLSGQGEEQWRTRALQAEAIAEKQAQILKEKVGPELVEFAKETLVQGLYTQRNALLETQTKAKQTLAELESRLSELNLASPERISAYEKRIAELQKQLESRGDEMRELTRATLLLVQEKLVQERQAHPPRFN